MASNELLKPTLHVEVLLKGSGVTPRVLKEIREAVVERLLDDFIAVGVGEELEGFREIRHETHLGSVEIADYTGPRSLTGIFKLQDVNLDVQAYVLNEDDPTSRRSIQQPTDTDPSSARVLSLPHIVLHEEWNSLVFDDALPSRLLRYLVRMTSMLSQPDLNLSTFNWNRLILLHGPPGSGKSTLCRALAQKLSIRLGDIFPQARFMEINTNAMLSKYFGESGKIIGATFESICDMAQDRTKLVCAVMDEVETIAGSRERSTNGSECHDGLRATNQLLTALDRLRNLPNVIVLCTSNLIEAIDPAFLDRVDIKQLIPSPSAAAIYNIFRSCLNELIRSSLVDLTAQITTSRPDSISTLSSLQNPNTRSVKTKAKQTLTSSSSASEPWTIMSAPTIPTFSEMKVKYAGQPSSAACRVWNLARKCQGFSGRTLRRLPILGLAMYTWGGNCSLDDAVSALEAAVDQELMVVKA